MKPQSLRGLQWIFLCLVFGAPLSLLAQTHDLHSSSGVSATDAAGNVDELKFVLIVSRHGVRSPTSKPEQLNQYSRQPWPAWSVPPGYLTEHGFQLMTLFGAYDRELLSSQGLLAPTGCSDADHIRIVADSDQRTRETGKALSAGLAPGCSVEIDVLPEGTNDPLFHFPFTNVTNEEKLLATAAVSGRISANPQTFINLYRTQIEELEKILSACKPEPDCLSTTHQPVNLFDLPSSLAPGKSDHLVDLRSPLSVASSLTENMLLEYTEGMEMSNVGWGGVDRQKLNDLLALHAASSEIAQRTPFIARAQSSNLLFHLLQSMQQSTTTDPVPGALSKPGDRLLILVGHDTNIATISGALGLNWIIDGRRDDTPPGGALVFELWQKHNGGESSVRVYYVAQTLDQMRNSTPLHLNNPPERVAVFVPGCSRADNSCSLKEFQQVIEKASLAGFVR